MTEKEQVIEGLTVLKDEMETVIIENVPVIQENKGRNRKCFWTDKKFKIWEWISSTLLLEDNASLDIYDEITNSYSTELSHCAMDILNCNVPARNVSQVISVVCRLCGRVPIKLSSR